MKLKTIKWLLVLLLLALFFIPLFIYAKIQASRGATSLLSEEPLFAKPAATDLVVIVHGYKGDPESMRDVTEATRTARPDSDILLLGYPAGTFSNADCFTLADRICERIAHYHTNKSYQRITMVGYSMGSLLLRKAYVYGRGHVEDRPGELAANNALQPKLRREWVQRVDRFVLLAGMNRGWSSKGRPKAMRLHRALGRDLGIFFAKLTGTGNVIMQCEQGAPFVANLRIQWLKAIRDLDIPERPTVIQLLGDIDDVVSVEDNRDIKASRNFVWVPVAGTGHYNVIQFDDSAPGKDRRSRFMQALGDDAAIAQLKLLSAQVPDDTDTNVVSVAIVLHGIRDVGEWTSQFEKSLQARFEARRTNGTKLLVYRPTYGYFPMGAFLLAPERQVHVRWFMDEFTELKAKYPNLDEDQIHFIGHSNGTYILASALQRYRSLRIGRAVFAGSVVPRDFDWAGVKRQIKGARNYVASADWVVAFFPRLFEWPVFKALKNDIGGAGFYGFKSAFTDQFGTNAQVRYVKGAHSAARNENYIESISSFIMDGTVQNDLTVTNRNPVVYALSTVCLVVWGLAAMVLYFGGRLFVRLVFLSSKALDRLAIGLHSPQPTGETTATVQPSATSTTLRRITWAVYWLLVWLLLNTY